MSHIDAEDALKIYRHFCSQTEKVVEFLGVARKLQNLLNVPIPNLKHVGTSVCVKAKSLTVPTCRPPYLLLARSRNTWMTPTSKIIDWSTGKIRKRLRIPPGAHRIKMARSLVCASVGHLYLPLTHPSCYVQGAQPGGVLLGDIILDERCGKRSEWSEKGGNRLLQCHRRGAAVHVPEPTKQVRYSQPFPEHV
jgi:hypothetical protein